MKQTKKSCGSESEWSDGEMEQFLWDSGVLTLAGVYGFQQAAADAFRSYGLRLATIYRDHEPQDFILHLSLYRFGDTPRKDRRQMRAVVRRVMVQIGCPVRPGGYEVAISGQRVMVSVGVPRWQCVRDQPG